MKSRSRRVFCTLVALTVVVGAYWQSSLPRAAERHVVPPEQSADVDIMLEKLHAAQDVLTGLVRRDDAQIAASGRRLVALCKADAWQQLADDPVYTHFSVEFQRQAEFLVRMAERKNFEGAAYVYQGLTSTCIACHEHVRDVRPLESSGENGSRK